jgi:hypothetical protein
VDHTIGLGKVRSATVMASCSAHVAIAFASTFGNNPRRGNGIA